MTRRHVPAVLLLAIFAGCGTAARDDSPSVTVAPTVQAPAPDPRLAQLETSIAELTERIDVLNERIGKVESGSEERPAPAAAAEQPAPAPSPVRSQPLERRPAVAPAPAPATESSPVRGANIADDYRNALMLYGKNNFNGARQAFQRVYDSEPTGELADNALYWIGETFYATGNMNEAMKYYRRVVDEFPEQNKAPDAMLKVGLVYVKIGDLLLARNSFEQLISKYPYSTPAAAAKAELKRIKY